MLIIVCGLPGSGKTTIAKRIATHFGDMAVHISSDTIRKKIFQTPEYTEEEKNSVYDEMTKEAARVIANGKIAIADATFYKQKYRDMILAAAKSVKDSSIIIYCEISEKEAGERLRKREKGNSDADFEVHKKLREEFEEIREKHLTIMFGPEGNKDSGHSNSEKKIERIINELDKRLKK